MRRGWAVAAACAAMTVYVCRGVPWGLALAAHGPTSWAADPAVLASQAGRLSWALWLCAAWSATGRAAAARLGLRWVDRWEELGLSFALGAGLWGTFLHLAGLAGLWRPWLLAASAFLPAWPLLLWLRETELRPAFPKGLTAKAAVFACGGVLAYHLPLLFVPETFYDALNYHLGMPNLYLLRGGIGPTPENSYSGVPSIPMMLFGQALALDRWGISARLVHFAFLPGVLVLMRGTAGRLGFPAAAPLACAAFALAPVVQGESFRTSTGLEWALFQLAAFHAFAAGVQAAPGTDERRGWTVLCGLQLGFAVSCKYPAASAGLGLAAAGLWVRLRRPDGLRAPSRNEVVFAAGLAAIVLAPWLGRNLAYYGNPLYPFFHDLLASGSGWMPDWRRITEGGLDLRALFTPGGLAAWCRHPLEWSRYEREFGAALGPALLGMAPALLTPSLAPAARLWCLMAAASWLPLSLVSRIPRFFIPGLGTWLLAAAWALERLPEPARRRAAAAGLGAALAGGTAFFVMRLPAYAHVDAALGAIGFREYLERERPGAPHYTPPHAAFHWLERTAAPDDRALLIGDARHFPWRTDHLASSEDQRSWLEVLAEESEDGSDLARRLAELRVRWIVMNRAEMSRLKTRVTLSARAAAAVKGLRLRPAFEMNDGERWVTVYEVSAAPAGSR